MFAYRDEQLYHYCLDSGWNVVEKFYANLKKPNKVFADMEKNSAGNCHRRKAVYTENDTEKIVCFVYIFILPSPSKRIMARPLDPRSRNLELYHRQTRLCVLDRVT